jgi:hypothetical protein
MRNRLVFFLRPVDEHHTGRGGEIPQLLVGSIVLALPLGEVEPRHLVAPGEPVHRGANASLIRASGAVEAIGNPSCRWT